jgi:hypothetical protein
MKGKIFTAQEVQAIGMGQFARLLKFMGHERLKPFISGHLSNLLEKEKLKRRKK